MSGAGVKITVVSLDNLHQYHPQFCIRDINLFRNYD